MTDNTAASTPAATPAATSAPAPAATSAPAPAATSAPAPAATSAPAPAAVESGKPARRRTIREHMTAQDRSAAVGQTDTAAAITAKAPSDAPPDRQITGPEAVKAASPPDRWPVARKELFSKQPPEVQEAWLTQAKEFEAGFTRKSQELSDKARIGESVRELLTDEHRSAMRSAGIVDEAGAFRYLLSQHDFYRRDPAGYIAAVMRNAQIDPRIFLQEGAAPPQTAGQQPPSAVHPGLLQELGVLRATVHQLSEREQSRTAQQIDTTIEAFETAKDPSGALAHPHFARVAPAMIEIIRSDPRVNGMPDGPEKLERAYDLAVWSDDELRKEIIDAETQRRIAAMQPPPQPPAKAPASIKPASGTPDTAPRRRRGNIRDALAATDKQFGM